MSTQKKKQKKRGRTGLILMLVILVLLLAIAAVLALYLRAPTDTAPVLPSPASVEEAEPAPDVAVPTVTPYVPVGLKLDVRTSVETLDVVVCDEEGNAVPGYAFELEISREGGGSHTGERQLPRYREAGLCGNHRSVRACGDQRGVRAS